MKKLIFLAQSFLVAILFSASLSACKKKMVEYQITGHAIDDTFGQPLTDCKIEVEGFLNANGTFTLISEINVDANGNFGITLPREKYATIRFKAMKSLYFENSSSLSVSDLDPNKANDVTVHSTAKSWVKLIFVNDNGSPSDILSVRKQTGKKDCEGCCNSENQVFTGTAGGTVLCENDGNTKFSYLYSSTGNNPTIGSTVSAAFDTTFTEIHY